MTLAVGRSVRHEQLQHEQRDETPEHAERCEPEEHARGDVFDGQCSLRDEAAVRERIVVDVWAAGDHARNHRPCRRGLKLADLRRWGRTELCRSCVVHGEGAHASGRGGSSASLVQAVRMRRAGVGVVLAFVVFGMSVSSATPAEITGGGALWTIDAGSGDTLWTREPTDRRLLHVTGAWKGDLRLTEERCVEFEPLKTRTHIVDARTGAIRSSDRKVWPPADQSVAPLGARGEIVSTTGGNDPAIVGFDGNSGKRLWRVPRRELARVSPGLVFSLSPYGDPRPVVEAHDRRSGDTKWTFPDDATSSWDGMVGVVPADSTTVVLADGDLGGTPPKIPTTFHILDALTGRERTAFTAANPKYRFSEIVMDAGALVYVEDASVVARSLTDGATLWTRRFDDVPDGTGVPDVSLTGGAGAPLLVQLSNPQVVALDPSSGTTTWQRSDALVMAAGPSTVVVRESFTKRLAGVDRQSGATRWRRTIPDAVTSESSGFEVDVLDGRVLVGKACDLG